MAQFLVTSLKCEWETATFYGTYLPTYSPYLSKSDYDQILQKVNKAGWYKFSPTALKVIQFLQCLGVVITLGGPFAIAYAQFPISTWILCVVYALIVSVLIFSFLNRYQDKAKQERKIYKYLQRCCSDLTTSLGEKGLFIEQNFNTKEVLIYYNPTFVRTPVPVNPPGYSAV
ncbi:hypothetical protein HDV06_000750 [Boothiomyces sp. JEL0866]|nr:hypothetical protein HDV06_000750 [Boothiomyces sp. JEL0866]